MRPQYSHLVSCTSQLAETHRFYHFLTERHIQALWLEQKYFRNLKTSEGELVEVISPGIWNLEAGPDFQKAHIKVGSQILQGDIEIDLSIENWKSHGHHLDARYDGVVLHLVLWKPRQEHPVVTLSGKKPTQAWLQDFLTLPVARLTQLIDLELYPYKQFVGSGKCASQIFRKLPTAQTAHFFQSAADWRLSQKKLTLQSLEKAPEQQLVAGIVHAMGYKHNSDSFLQLYHYFIRSKIRSEEMLLALGLRAFGFFSEAYQKRWGQSPYYQTLLRLAYENDQLQVPVISLSVHPSRPLNHPIRRLVYLLKGWVSGAFDNVYSQLMQRWQMGWTSCHNKAEWRRLSAELLKMIPELTDEYWNHHYTFEMAPSGNFLSLAGASLQQTILINGWFPLLHQEIQSRENEGELRAFYELYQTYPSSDSGKTRYLTHRFFGESDKGKILKQAYIEQGAYQLHHDFCVHYEASCEGCPFIEKFQTHFEANKVKVPNKTTLAAHQEALDGKGIAYNSIDDLLDVQDRR